MCCMDYAPDMLQCTRKLIEDHYQLCNILSTYRDSHNKVISFLLIR